MESLKKRKKQDQEHDRQLANSTLLRAKRRSERSLQMITSSDVHSKTAKSMFTEKEHFLTEIKPRTCYCCKKKYTAVHFFYDQLCPFCSSLNFKKRNQTADLKGRIALVTGARVKIGFECALRCGAFVIATTRFPHDAALRYAKEADFTVWKDRIHIYGIDVPAVERFTEFLCTNYKSLNIIINNAAQTIRRPPSYYLHLLSTESSPITESLQPLLLNHFDKWSPQSNLSFFKETKLLTNTTISPSSVLPVVPMTIEDRKHDVKSFPTGSYDKDGQQLDCRTSNTWSSKIEDVTTVELVEVQAVNAIAPFVLCSKLKPLFKKSKHWDKYIINVSSMEGKFGQPHKNDRHPHTNMAKASLNMMTLTIASSYAEEGIFVNAVDTGWVTDEHPNEKMRQQQFEPPLDECDGMARVLDPVFRGVNSQEFEKGLFFKDYQVSKW